MNVASFRHRLPTPQTILLWLIVLGSAATTYVLVYDWHVIRDERFHHRQIDRFVQRDFTMHPDVTMLPGYHAAVALLMEVVPGPTRWAGRLINVGFGLAMVLICLGIARQLSGRVAAARALQVYFLPLLFPFYFLLYTDVLALAVVLGAFYCTLKRWYTAAGLAMVAAMLVRQNHVMWIAFLGLYSYVDLYGWRVGLGQLLEHARRCWMLVLAGLAFVGFVLVNGGVAIGDREMHPPMRLSLGNLYFCMAWQLLLVPILHPPAVGRLVRWLRQRPLPVAGALAALAAVVAVTMQVDHPYNRSGESFRSDLLLWVDSGVGPQVLFGGLAALGMLLTAATALRSAAAYAVYPVWLLALLPAWLIDPRYYFVPWALWLLLRKEREPGGEWASAGVFAVLAGVVMGLVAATTWFFP